MCFNLFFKPTKNTKLNYYSQIMTIFSLDLSMPTLCDTSACLMQTKLISWEEFRKMGHHCFENPSSYLTNGMLSILDEFSKIGSFSTVH